MAFGGFFSSFERKKDNQVNMPKVGSSEKAPSVEGDVRELSRQIPEFLRQEKETLARFEKRFNEIKSAVEIDPLKERINDEFIRNARMEIPESIRSISKLIRRIDEVNSQKQSIGMSTRSLLVDLNDKFKLLNSNIPQPWDERKNRSNFN